MVIEDFNIKSVPMLPSKADAPPIVDADAVLSPAPPFESLKSVGRWDSQIPESLGLVQHPELPKGDALEIGGEAARRGSVEQRLCVSRLKRSDHTATL